MQFAKINETTSDRATSGHGWPDWQKDMSIIAEWLDQHLKPRDKGKDQEKDKGAAAR